MNYTIRDILLSRISRDISILTRGIYFHKKSKLFRNAPENFQNFSEISNFFPLDFFAKSLPLRIIHTTFKVKVFQDCFLSYCIKSFPKLRKKFPQISRIYQNFFYQTSKLFRKNTEIPKLFRYDYIRINGNIQPWFW